ncbi:putative protein DUF4837 [Leeuwenhoekiella aestuarii]|uniref:DUF4837 domain-containing protein n=1 Tax=Leeuwenhoekiella aestuarii TaxID=2249426 RepID=A0A4Q0NYE4_9FLAO|nr:DUF4837 family protein [Leeuwenhoekiella aestuarii]RXG17930.1 putative protein DUF4837 [Leeuwenhoekiella aestuarii]RXG19259.1 putative protein DUF4837 [Leeuwenhoekiella aestuarii]
MQKLLLAFFLFALVACNDKPQGKILSASSGGLNNLTVVMPNDLWSGQVGENIREKLAGPVNGLPQVEPMFEINQMPNEAFSGFMRKQRTFLKVEQADTASLEIVYDEYARPQTGIIIKGPTEEDIINLIKKDSAKIVDTYKDAEFTEKIRRISLSLKDDKPLTEAFGITMKFPSAYRYAKEDSNFYWIRKDIPNGDMNITVYEVPYNLIDKDSNTIGSLIKMRDSIGGDNITVSEGMRFITEEAFAPYLSETTIDGKPAYQMKGMWEVKGRFMAGPFVNFTVDDKENDRYLVLEGFVFKPSANKRDNIFELESILRSVKFVD